MSNDWGLKERVKTERERKKRESWELRRKLIKRKGREGWKGGANGWNKEVSGQRKRENQTSEKRLEINEG